MAKHPVSRQPNADAANVETSGVAAAAPREAISLSRQRIPLTIDPFGEQGSALASTLLPLRTEAITRIYLGMQQVQKNLGQIAQALSAKTLPASIVGSITEPDGTNAARIQVQFDPGTVGNSAPPVTAITGDDGSFMLSMPPGALLPDSGITLAAHGANGNASVTVPAQRIASNGLIGTIALPTPLSPLPTSILASLAAIVPAGQLPDATAQGGPPAELPTVRLGEEGACGMNFAAGKSVEIFPYGIFFRLVEPRLSIVNRVIRHPIREGVFLPLPIYETMYGAASLNGTQSSYIDRLPVEQPLSVDGFRDQMMGLGTDGTIGPDETVPMAATLGLGYMLSMSQRWTYQGVSLGDLLYSLPLAPGEQQQVAIFEREDRTQVYESEFFSEQEAERQTALSDTSAQATFNSAFEESVRAGSQFSTTSVSASAGFSFIGFGGGAGTSSTGGSSSEWLNGQRDTAQQAAEQTHSASERQASARRSAMRTGIRMASASESQSVTTKTITNHNHTRALTMQYWEVLRLFDVATAIDGLTLVCLVPMQIVRFLPPGQAFTLTNTAMQIGTRDQVLTRYGNILKHADVLAKAMPRAFQYGLTLLREFAADPTAVVEPAGGMAEDVIAFSLTGRFVPCENIYVTAITKRNTRVGPVQLTNTLSLTQNFYTTKDDLLAGLQLVRDLGQSTFHGSLALPPTLNRNDIVGFEIYRSFRRVDYTLKNQAVKASDDLIAALGEAAAGPIIGPLLAASNTASAPPVTVHLSPADLESALSGPALDQFTATITEYDTSNPTPPSAESYANESLGGVILPPQPLPVPAMQIGPVLRYNEILEIEKMAQHVLRNTTEYSKAVWSSLTVEERAILLDAYTIGVSPDGISDESQMVPLLNCVQNRLLGFFGNSMLFPFIIPQAVAEQMKIDPAKIQQGLLAYQQATFDPPHSTVALPTRGVLGEAVLGHCASAEKIDLRRFWNWQDSPADTAPAISPVTLPTGTPSLTAGAAAPNSLANLPPLINNVLNAPTPDTSLLQAMGKNAASQQDFSAALTGAAQLAPLMQNAQTTANAARQDALKSATDTQMMAMAIAGNIVGGMYGGNPTAGSSAASAITGKGAPAKSDTSSSSTSKKKKTTTDGGDGSSSDGSSSDGTGTDSGGSNGGP